MDCLELLLEIFESEENLSLVAESDLVLDLLDELVEIDDIELIEALEELEDENDFLLLSIVGDEIIVEEYLDEDGNALIIDNDLVIIQEGILDEEEIEELVFADDILILEISEENDENSDGFSDLDLDEEILEDDILRDLATDFFDLLSKDECVVCELRELLCHVYNMGKEDLLEKINEL